MKEVSPLSAVGVCLSAVFPAACCRAFDVFNDSIPETQALEIWRITNDQSIRHHSNYHNIDPFSPDGRYIIYTVRSPKRSTWQGGTRARLTGFVVLDLQTKQEVYRSKRPSVRPIWAHHGNVVYWVREGAPRPNRALCRLDLSKGGVPQCDDLTARRIPRRLETISFDDRYLFGAGPMEWTDPAKEGQWVIWRVDPNSLQEPTLLYRPEAFPRQIAYEPRAHPNRPLLFARHVRLESTPTGVRHTTGQQGRFLVTLDGRYLGPVLPDYMGAGHVCWSGDGRLFVHGDGPLRGREDPFIEPGDWKILSTETASDVSPCGVSGQWLVGIGGINGRIFVADTRTGYTRLICHPASIIHQPRDDKRDLSGPYDSDPHGSPDGTKIFFSTNYALNDYPITRTLSRVRRAKDGTGPPTLDVESTAGFPESGVLSVWCCLVTYKGKEPTRFLGCTWRYGDTRFPPAIGPGVVVTDYRGRCAKLDPAAPLAHQAATDVYIVVARRPDPPTLVVQDQGVRLHPGYNHRETREHCLYLDGHLLVRLPVNVDLVPFVLPRGGVLSARAVEWSGLASPESNTVTVQAGMSVVVATEALSQPRTPKPAVINQPGGIVETRYHSPDGWPCQVLESREGQTPHRRTLYEAPDRVFSVEEYDQSGRRIKETLYDQGRIVSEWTRFEGGRAVERWHLRYGLFPVHEKLVNGGWTRVGR